MAIILYCDVCDEPMATCNNARELSKYDGPRDPTDPLNKHFNYICDPCRQTWNDIDVKTALQGIIKQDKIPIATKGSRGVAKKNIDTPVSKLE